MTSTKQLIVILGASGDLAKRKLIPALLKLCENGQIERSMVMIGSGRSAFTHEEFRALFNVPETFASRLFYHQGIPGLRAYAASKGEFSRVVVFFALPPEVYSETAKKLSDEGFGPETSVIVEKPFGSDFSSAEAINRELWKYFNEANIYRNDHYLAKEAVQNILVFRFANSLFYPVWNNQYIESIQINASETQGIGTRGAYFDKAGILRDMVQNHLMQLVCLLTMEAPLSLAPNDIIEKKIEILRALRIDKCYRHQYDGYKTENGVSPQSETETYAELRLYIENFRWAGVPVYIRCGKKLNRDGTEIGVRFKHMPMDLFGKQADISSNIIVFMIQPREGIIVSMASKEPGVNLKLINTNITFCYHESFDKEIPEAYQRLLLDTIRGDRTLFVHSREAELSWKLLDRFLDKGALERYKDGSVPATHFDVEWIDFESYCRSCSRITAFRQ